MHIFSSLDSNNSSLHNSIPTKILKLLKNSISYQLSDIVFNISFYISMFPSMLKTAKVVLVDVKNSKLDFFDYRPIWLLSSLGKVS